MTTSSETKKNYVAGKNSKELSNTDTNKNDKAASFDNDFDTDGELSEMNVRKPYSYMEDKEILQFILQSENIFKVYSVSLWKYFEGKKKKPKRTYQSLKNRFLRNIKPNLFKAYGHLIDNEDAVEKILIKFPELKEQLESQQRVLRKDLQRKEKIIENVELEKNETNERTVKINKDEIIVTVNTKKSQSRSAQLLGMISERFQVVNKINKGELCFACGRFYSRPDSKFSSKSSEDNDIPNSGSPETDENSQEKDTNNSSNKDNSRNETASLQRNPESPVSQSLLSSLEESNSLSVKHNVRMQNDIEERMKCLGAPAKKQKKTDEWSDISDSDVEIIYEESRKRFPKLIDSKKEKTQLKKCFNKEIEFTNFSTDAEKSLESFFLETPLEMPTPTPFV